MAAEVGLTAFGQETADMNGQPTPRPDPNFVFKAQMQLLCEVELEDLPLFDDLAPRCKRTAVG